MMYRLPPVPGEWIDRSSELSFEFEGRSFKGYAGDTIHAVRHVEPVPVVPPGTDSFINLTSTRSPCRARIVGPGVAPLRV